MKKRLFAVLLSLVALGLMAGSAMASETIKFTLTGTVDGTAAFSEEFSFDPSVIALISSTDVGDSITIEGTNIDFEGTVLDPADSLLGTHGLLSKDILEATNTITVSSSSSTVKFAVSSANDGVVLDANADGAVMAFYDNDWTLPAIASAFTAAAGDTISDPTTLYIPVSVKKVEDPTATRKTYVEYGDGKSVVFVAVKAKFQAIVDGEALDLPRTFTGRAATTRLANETFTDTQLDALWAKGYNVWSGMDAATLGAELNLFLNKSIANELGYAVDDVRITGANPATASQAKKVKAAGVDGVQAIAPEMEFANRNTSAYVFAPRELSDETKKAIAAGDAGLYLLDLTRSHANVSVAEYGKAEPADDAIFLIYDKDAAEFRAPDEDDDYDLLFVAFSREPGTFQAFFATGEAPVDPSKPEDPSSKPEDPSSKPEDPSSKPEDPSSKPEDPSSKPEDPSNPSSPVNPSGSHKSSGSSGCDMGMVSGLAILLAALLPLRRVRR